MSIQNRPQSAQMIEKIVKTTEKILTRNRVMHSSGREIGISVHCIDVPSQCRQLHRLY